MITKTTTEINHDICEKNNCKNYIQIEAFDEVFSCKLKHNYWKHPNVTTVDCPYFLEHVLYKEEKKWKKE